MGPGVAVGVHPCVFVLAVLFVLASCIKNPSCIFLHLLNASVFATDTSAFFFFFDGASWFALRAECKSVCPVFLNVHHMQRSGQGCASTDLSLQRWNLL